jgi:hypothetical protein
MLLSCCMVNKSTYNNSFIVIDVCVLSNFVLSILDLFFKDRELLLYSQTSGPDTNKVLLRGNFVCYPD